MNQKSIQCIVGDESFLIQEHVDQLRHQYADHACEMIETANLEQLRSLATMPSLFHASRFICIKNPWFFFQAISDKELAEIIALLDAINPDQTKCCFYILGKTLDQRKKAVKAIKKAASFVEYKSYKDWEQGKVMQWIKERFAKYQINLTDDALLAFEQIGGTNLSVLANEIEKFRVYLGDQKQLSLSDIQQMAQSGAATVFHFSEAMKSRRVKDCYKIVTHWLDNKEEPVKILGLIAANLRLYISLLSLLEQKLPVAKIAQKTKKNPYFLQKLLPEVKKNHHLPRLLAAHKKLNQLDIQLKSGQIDPKTTPLLAITVL